MINKDIEVVNITGPMGAGKGTVANYFKEKHGFSVLYFATVLKEETARRGLEINRWNLIQTHDALRKEQGEDILAQRIVADAIKQGLKKIVFDGARKPALVTYIKNKFPEALLLYIDSDKALRRKRVIERERDIDPSQAADLDKVMARDLKDASSCKHLPGVIVIENNGDLASLKQKLDSLWLQ